MNRATSTVCDRHTSGYSANGSAECLEVGWHVSGHSPNGGKSCVEAGPVLGGSLRFAVRDSTRRELGFLSFGRSEWAAFVRSVKRGEP